MTNEEMVERYKARLEQHRAYHAAHKAERNAYFKLWYAKNKEELAVRRRNKRIQRKNAELLTQAA